VSFLFSCMLSLCLLFWKIEGIDWRWSGRGCGLKSDLEMFQVSFGETLENQELNNLHSVSEDFLNTIRSKCFQKQLFAFSARFLDFGKVVRGFINM
jgi:hypothetical protein